MLKKDLKTLKININKNLKKGFIYKLKSLTYYFILFILKKSKELQIYINYKKLNNIIIKNTYILLLINKLKQYFINIKIFT